MNSSFTPLALYAKKWQLSNPQLLSQTLRGEVYLVERNEKKFILKILSDIGQKYESQSASILKSCNGQAMIQLYEYDKKALLMEYMPGTSLVKLVRSGHDSKATEIIGNILVKIHRSPIVENLASLREYIQPLFEQAALGRGDQSSLFVRAAQVAEKLLQTNRNIVLLHGDIHHENILGMNNEWKAINPKGLVGEAAYDGANTLCNPRDMSDLVESDQRILSQAEILAKIGQFNVNRLLSYVFVHAALNACWNLEADQDAGHAINMAIITEPYLKPIY